MFRGYRVKARIIEMVLTESWWKQKSQQLQLARDFSHLKKQRVKAWRRREMTRQYKLLRVMGVWRYVTRPDLFYCNLYLVTGIEGIDQNRQLILLITQTHQNRTGHIRRVRAWDNACKRGQTS